MSTFFPCSPQVDAKGAIYLTTKNGTFPISLTPAKPREAAPKIVSSTAQNASLASSYERDYWETTDEILSNYVNLNVTYGETDTRYMWKNKRSINDAVSRNITLVLENLLKNYENSQLPTHGKGMQYWRDTRLSFLGPIRSLSLSIKMLERIWRPDTYFYNGKHSYVHTITVPNKLLRISQHGDILYSMRLTIKAKCPMELRSFPMDRQSCPLILGSYAYSNQQLVYQWQNSESVNFVPGMTLSQFDLISFPYRNFTFTRREGITTVLTLSTISLDSRTDLPKVRYATALDWFLLMSFFYCIATLLEFAGVHYFTKVGSGEIVIDDAEWEELIEEVGGDAFAARQLASFSLPTQSNCSTEAGPAEPVVRLTMERTTQTEARVPRWRQLLYCLAGDDLYRRKRQVEAGKNHRSYTYYT
ncbi:hypothetical protein MSG28_015257 [Choristoneura fumiferana]|uniref:Uncharacterized protein n=1 Tax=Choristoneura fumiferana TaxID=7141 RepID=A0ACC0KZF1_CHOFU|nr:hypothetical protein MSG28_015257 [Choristoneura fumiferana]